MHAKLYNIKELAENAVDFADSNMEFELFEHEMALL